MEGKIVVITGASDGIGLSAARELAARGAHLYLVGRNETKTEEAAARIISSTGNTNISTRLADLSSLAEVRGLADDLTASTPKIDVLINNAGGMFMTRQESVEGIEMTFALNHLSYFLLTHRLLEHLARAGTARVVSTASAAHHGAALDFADLENKKKYKGFAVYQQSKLCNLYFTFELARRAASLGITANALHPGFVASNFGNNNGSVTRGVLWLAKRVSAVTPDEGAKTIVYLAASQEVADVTGQYFAKCRQAPVSAMARSDAAARELWDISLRMTGETE